MNKTPLLKRFTKVFALGLSIILEFNYFYMNNYFDHQIKGTAMETIFAIVRSNLTVTYFLKKCLLFYHKFFQKTLLNFFFVVTSFNF